MWFRLTLLALSVGLALSAQVAGKVSEKTQKLHDDAFVMDGHVHVINRQFYEHSNIGTRYDDGQVDLVRMKEGGLDALFFVIFTAENYYPGRFETKHALRLMDLALSQIEQNDDKVELALNAADIERINAKGKIAAVLDLEGSVDLDGDLGVLRMFHRLGLRVLQLPAHNWANEYADSCCSKQKWGGLNDHGREFVREMNRLGMVINISHASDETVEDALEVSEDPLVATHSGLRSFNDIPRVMPEELLKKVAAKGGVIGFHIGNSFHNRAYHEWRTKRNGRAFWDTSPVEERVRGKSISEIDKMVGRGFSGGPIPPDELRMAVDDWLKVVERAIEVAGEDHVALGSDFDGGPTPPKGMSDISDLPLLTEGMLRRGWSEQRIRKFLGGNLLRVFREVTGQ
ncbi:MAG: dipeptidase [Acidobacteria bacterium]|nr:dipeptidase [Acidobacteriota bacterium]